MANWGIGVTGLQAAQKGIEVIGMNIANASTDGYHKQDLKLASIAYSGSSMSVGGGVEIQEIRRRYDILLENQVLRQQPEMGQVEQELEILASLESALGDLDSSGVPSSLNEFFAALNQLTAQPDSQAHLENAVWSGENLASHLRNLSSFIKEMKEHVKQETFNAIELANKHLQNVTEQNQLINDLSSQAGNTNVVQDKRDQALMDLAQLMPAQIGYRDDSNGTITVHGWGMPLVLNARPTLMKVEIVDDSTLGVGPKSATSLMTDVRGGEIGGLLELYNETLPDLQGKINALATTLRDKMNTIHVQGLGNNGSFQVLEGTSVPAEPFDEWTREIAAGTIHMRVTDQSTGDVVYHEIDIDPDDHSAGPPIVIDTMAELVSHINTNIPNMTASLPDAALKLQAADGYTFDFLPETRLTTSGTWVGTTPEVSGYYQGERNQVYTATVVGPTPGADEAVGVTSGLRVEVRDGAGELVADLTVGKGYSPGEPLNVSEGLSLTFPSGTLREGETFEFKALAESDETGLMNATNINTFFQGDSGEDLQVVKRLMEDSNNFAFSASTQLSDNTNVTRMAAVGDGRHGTLNNLTPDQFVRSVWSTVGQEISTKEARRDGLYAVEKQLLDQRDTVSGVDINEEAAQLIMYEKMYQAVAKFLTTQNDALQHLMNLIQ